MSMGIVSDEDFLKELERIPSFPIPVQETEVEIEHGRGNRPAVPEALKKIIIDEAIAGASAKEISEGFGVSQSSVSAYKVGAHSTSSYHKPDKNLTNHIKSTKLDLSNLAMNKLKMAIEAITEDKLESAKLSAVSSVGRDMSAIVKNMSDNVDTGNTINNQVIIFKPRMRDEDDYEVIEVQE